MTHPVLEQLPRAIRALHAHGFPTSWPSPWWVDTLTRFYSSPARQLVLRCGRRAGKSSTLTLVACLEAVFGHHAIPPGELGLIPIVSVDRTEASARLRLVETILRALAVPYTRSDDTIELTTRPIAFRVVTASISGTSGFTSVFVLADEVAKWRDRDTGANPATEVLASLRPTTATTGARMVLCSSPMGPDDAHARAFDEGETPHQQVAHAPTWIANPQLSEAATRALETDERIWLREYAAVPQASRLAAFDVGAIDRAMMPRDFVTRARPIIILDPSSGRSDAWTWCTAGYATGPQGTCLHFGDFRAVTGKFWQQVSGDEIVNRVVAYARERGITSVHADQRESLMLSSAFSAAGLAYNVHTWGNANKTDAVERLRRMLKEGSLSCDRDEDLRRELLAFEERTTPSGSLTFGGRREHDDRVALLITGVIADLAGYLATSANESIFGDDETSKLVLADIPRRAARAMWSRWGNAPRGF
jgi:hypothetical protein